MKINPFTGAAMSALFTCLVGVAEAQPNWNGVAANPPATLGPGHTVAVPKDGKFYVIGRAMARDVWPYVPYDPQNPVSTDQWEAAQQLSALQWDSTAVVAPDGNIYVIGGREGTGSHPPATAKVLVHNPDNNNTLWPWHSSLNVARVKPAAAVGADGKIYVFGGTDTIGQPILTIESLDPLAPSPSWTLLASPTLPSGKTASLRAAADHSGTIYLSSTNAALSFTAGVTPVLTQLPLPPASLPFLQNPSHGSTLAEGQNGRIYNILGGSSYAFATPGLGPIPFEANIPTTTWLAQPEAAVADGRIFRAGPGGAESYEFLKAWITGTGKAFLPLDDSSSPAGCAATTVPAAPPPHAIATFPAGRVNKAANFNGNQSLTYPKAPCFDMGTGNFSVDFWIRHNQPSGLGSIFDYRDTAGKGIHAAMWNGKVVLQMASSSGYTNSVSWWGTPTVIPTGQWTHVAFSVDRTSATPKGSIWVNGAYAGPISMLASGLSLDSAGPMRIGSHSNKLSNYRGDLDELRFYSKALTWHEVRSIFLAGHQGKL